MVLDGRMRTIDRENHNAPEIVNLLKAGKAAGGLTPAQMEQMRSLIDVPTFVAVITDGRVKISETEVRLDDVPVTGAIADRLLATVAEGLDQTPLVRFLERIEKHEFARDVKEDLFAWLESGHTPLTSDGCFLAFKKVRDDYRSFHASPDGSHLLHEIGKPVSMPREEVNSDRYECHSGGLHFCSHDYLGSYYGSTGRVVILKIAPEDVVAIPTDSNRQKGRAWKYDVVAECPREEVEKFFHTSVNSVYDTPAPVGDECVCDSCDDDVPADSVKPDEPSALQEIRQTSGIAAKIGVVLRRIRKNGRDGINAPDGKFYTVKQLQKLVDTHGQRGAAAQTGIARATLQRAIGALND